MVGFRGLMFLAGLVIATVACSSSSSSDPATPPPAAAAVATASASSSAPTPSAPPQPPAAPMVTDDEGDASQAYLDILGAGGLGMLSVVEECVDLVEQHQGRVVDLSRIDMEDAAVFDDICRGDTVGVFQIESRAQIAMLPRTLPRSLDDLTVQVSIVRPGPIVGGAVNSYVRRREARRKDPHYMIDVPECVREALEETLGWCSSRSR